MLIFIPQLKSKLKAARAEIADYKEEQVSVREELALTIEELQRELKLRYRYNSSLTMWAKVGGYVSTHPLQVSDSGELYSRRGGGEGDTKSLLR